MSNKYEGILVSHYTKPQRVFLFLEGHKISQEGAVDKAIHFAEKMVKESTYPVNLPEEWREMTFESMAKDNCKDVSFVGFTLQFSKVDVN